KLVVSDFQNVITVLCQQGRAFYAFFHCVKRLIFEHLQIVFVNCMNFKRLALKTLSSLAYDQRCDTIHFAQQSGQCEARHGNSS
ncbi:hypothetical protein OFN34_34445, partial [Escherichia coli]|nr:hypothetical protein [Escherichia coli]